MKKKVELYGKSNGERIVFNDSTWMDKYKAFAKENKDKDVQLIITCVTDAKSLAQLRFYWGAVIPAISEATGISDRFTIHDLLKQMYLLEIKEVTIKEKNVFINSINDVGELDKDSMRIYIDKCIEFLVDNGGKLDHDEVDYYEQGFNNRGKVAQQS